MKKIVAVFCLSFCIFNASFAQPFTHADTFVEAMAREELVGCNKI